MSHDTSGNTWPTPNARRRDRSRLLVTALTGVATAGSLTATGWVAGQAAQAWTEQSAPPAPAVTKQGAPPNVTTMARATRSPRHRTRKPRVVVRQRPSRTRTTTQYVTAPAPVGGGGTVSGSSHASHPAPSSGS